MADSKTGFSLGSFLGDIGLTAANGFINSIGSLIGQNRQVAKQKELLDYQMQKYYSPQAQVKNLAAAGINPAVAFGNQSPVFSSGGSLGSVEAPQFGIGTTSLSDLASYIKAQSDAKKAGVEIPNIEEDTKNRVLKNESDAFELDLKKRFGLGKAASELALAQEKVKLAQQEGDINKLEIARKDWEVAKEKAMSECEANKRDILAKELENTDTRLRLENEESRQRAAASQASASASYAQASHFTALAKTENDLRDLKVTAHILANGLSALEFEYDSGTLQNRIQKLSEELGVVKWTALLSELEYRDKSAYTALQRIFYGRSIKGDASTVMKALHNFEELQMRSR